MQSHFTETIFYQVELTSKYFKLMSHQVFEKYNVDIVPEEFGILDTLYCNQEMCQRDIAKAIFKDRANTGKLLDSLEKKGFITRKLSIKNNRPVKIAEITEKGKIEVQNVMEKLEPHMQLVKEKIENSDLIKLTDLLKELRKVLDSTLEIKI